MSIPNLGRRAKTALYLVAGGMPRAAVAEQTGYSVAYLRRLCISPAGRDYLASVEAEARRAVADAMFAAWAQDRREPLAA
jgi:hypothetical protein